MELGGFGCVDVGVGLGDGMGMEKRGERRGMIDLIDFCEGV